MWVLFLIMLASPGLPATGTPLAGFTSYQDCKEEEDRIQAEMYKLYPTETHTFYLKCLIRSKEVS